jgi:hypothetical protein
MLCLKACKVRLTYQLCYESMLKSTKDSYIDLRSISDLLYIMNVFLVRSRVSFSEMLSYRLEGILKETASLQQVQMIHLLLKPMHT